MNALQLYFLRTGDTPFALAKRIDRHASTVTRVARGERGAGPQLAKDIAAATGHLVSAAQIRAITVESDLIEFAKLGESHRRGAA